MRSLLLQGVVAVTVVTLTGAASGGANFFGTGWLSWVGTWENPDTDLETMPRGTQYLYIQLGGVGELEGCEFELRWYPAGALLSGCYEFASGAHPSGSGTGCAWLMRGDQVEGMNEYSETYWRVAFAADEANHICSSGNVARALFDFSFCENIQGAFCLEYVKVTDAGAILDELAVTGDATLMGGVSAQYYPCAITDRPTTWGAIKTLYR